MPNQLTLDLALPPPTYAREDFVVAAGNRDLRRIFKKKLEERREFIRRYTAFGQRELTQDIDYRHKRGLLM